MRIKTSLGGYASTPAIAGMPVSGAEYENETLSEEEPQTIAEAMEQYNQRMAEQLRTLHTERKDGFVTSVPPMVDRFGNLTTAPPRDNSAGLTSRLVASTVESQVQSVIADAHVSMMNLRLVAALDKGENGDKARAYLRKLDRLVNRAQGKMRELRNEDLLRSRQKKAEGNKQRKRAEKTKEELRKKQVSRATKENAWLLDGHKGLMHKIARSQSPSRLQRTPEEQRRLEAAIEAAIAVEAEIQAAMESAAEATGCETGEAAAVGGGEVVLAGGAEAPVPMPEGSGAEGGGEAG